MDDGGQMAARTLRNVLVPVFFIAALIVFVCVLWSRSRPEQGPPPPSQIDRLVARTRSGEVRAQCQAIAALGQARSPRALPVLLHKLKHPRANVREAAARALGHYGDPKAVKPLVGALDDKRARVRFSAVRALGRLADPGALPALKQRVDSGDTLAADAALAIGKLKTPKAESVLLKALFSPRMNVRLGAIDGLALCGTREAIAPLEKLLRNPLAGLDPAFLARADAVGETIEPIQVAGPCKRTLAAVRARAERGKPQ